MAKTAFLSIIFIFLFGCYSLRVDKQLAGLDSVDLRQNFFFFGLIGDKEINLVDQCPAGVAGFHERITVGDALFSLLTIGLYTPKTVSVNCKA